MNAVVQCPAVCSRLRFLHTDSICHWTFSLLLLWMALVCSPASAAVPARSSNLQAAGPPIFFYPDTTGNYAAQGRGWQARFTADRVRFHWSSDDLSIRLVDHNPQARITASAPSGTVNLLQSSDRRHWRSALPLSS